MRDLPDPSNRARPVVVVGAGIGGLAVALRLAAAGLPVILFERAAAPGGKMRTVESAAGPVDAGPTVLTMRPVFEALFAAAQERLEDHLRLDAELLLARHFWPDGSTLDLHADRARNVEAVQAFAGKPAARAFERFAKRAKRLYRAFEGPIIQAPDPTLSALTQHVLRAPGLIPALAPGRTLAQVLAQDFRDPRLAQLFGRYATYVGGSPYRVPALLQLIWSAEEAGVWSVQGGMHALAQAVAKLAARRGVEARYGIEVATITVENDCATGVRLADGRHVPARAVVFNGDPRALAAGLMGPAVAQAAPTVAAARRSLSARVWSFAAAMTGPALAHHNVFFCANPRAEFDALAAGREARDPTLYVCAQDRSGGRPAPDGPERFEIIQNAPALVPAAQPVETEEERAACRTRTFETLARFGLTFAPEPEPTATTLTGPAGFEALFPGSLGALYGQSPEAMTAALARPQARSQIPRLYLVGGGCHPGAGVPMATLSARHAAEAMLTDLASTSR